MLDTKSDFSERIKVDSLDINSKIKGILNSLQIYYDKDLINSYKEHFSEEYAILRGQFPDIDFSYEGRIKNPNSLKEKIHRKLSQGKTGNIYDIYAKKIVVYSANGSKNEAELIDACYSISDFLNTYNESLNIIPDKYKDYIKAPKTNRYQAIHVLREHASDNLPQYISETQIRTFRMEEFQKFGTASHMLSYKPSETLKAELCPTFLEIGKTGKTHVLSKKASLQKYKSDYDALQDYFHDLKQKRH